MPASSAFMMMMAAMMVPLGSSGGNRYERQHKGGYNKQTGHVILLDISTTGVIQAHRAGRR